MALAVPSSVVQRFTSALLLLVASCAAGDGRESAGNSGLASSDSSGGTSVESGASESSGTPGSTTSPDPTSTTSSTTESGDDSSSSGTGSQTWHRYSFDMVTGVWSRVSLEEIWIGANAPPPAGISAAVSFTHFDRLFVITDDGTVYEQAGGVWQPPQALGTRFPAAVDLQVTAMTHTPGQDLDTYEDIYFVDAPVAVVYTVFENGGVELVQVAELMDAEGGAPQASVDNEWTIALADPSGIGDPDWLRWYGAYADELWLFNAGFEWTMFPLVDNPFFNGVAGEPDPFAVRAAYFEDAFGRAHFIAP